MYIFKEENMLAKLFPILQKREGRKEESYDWDVALEEFQEQLRLPKLDDNQIRLLIFRDCDKRGKTLLFDSDAVVPIENQSTDASPFLVRGSALNAKPSHGRAPSPKKYQYVKPSSDTKVLGEMVFGSVAMTYKGSTIRIHLIRFPVPQLLVSKVFALKSRTPSAAISESDFTSSASHSESLNNSIREINGESLSISANADSRDLSGPVSNPMPTPKVIEGTAFNTSFYGGSVTSIDSLGLSASMNSLNTSSQSPGGSFHRRFYRSQVTSMGNSNMYGRRHDSGDENFAAQSKQPKISISAMFKLWEGNEEKCSAFQNFFFAHYTLFEAHLEKIKISIEKAFYLRKNFISVAKEATERLKTEIKRLYYSPRISEPVWLNLMAAENQHLDMVQRFTCCLMKVVDVCEKKETNYFLSSVLTAVLSHHLAWVPTVTPSGSIPIRSYLDKHSSKTVDILAKCHPYNPLWAQLGDLYGTIGFPLKISKTIVVGKHRDLVCQLLYILSYFIRCSDVRERVLKADNKMDLSTLSIDPSTSVSETSSVADSGSRTEDETPVDRNLRTPVERRGERLDRNVTPTNSPLSCQEGLKNKGDTGCMCDIMQNNINSVGRRNMENLTISRANTLKKGAVKNEIGDLGLAVKNIRKIYSHIYDQGLFKCYCCPEGGRENQFAGIQHIEVSGNSPQKRILDTNCSCGCNSIMPSRLKSNLASSLIDAEKRDSGGEYDAGSSNDTELSTCISRTSSYASCSDLFKDTCSPDLDSDYCSTNEDLYVSHDGTEPPSQRHTYRQISEDSISEDEILDIDFQELPLLRSREKKVTHRNQDLKPEPCNLGRSLFAGFCESQISDFVLQGVEQYDHEEMVKDLQFSVTRSVLDEPVGEAACIVADTDNWTCKVWTFQRKKDPVMLTTSESLDNKLVVASEMVSEMVDTVRSLNDVALPFPIVLMRIEDALKYIYTQSKVVAEYARSLGDKVPRALLEEKFRYHESDIDLLIAAASTHTPYVSQLIE